VKIPAIFYGTSGEVSSRVVKLVKQLLSARNFASYEPGPFLDTADIHGDMLVSREHGPSLAAQFHCYLLPTILESRAPIAARAAVMHEWLMGSLEEEWRFLCTLGGDCHAGFGINKVAGARRYAEAAVRHWPALAAEQYRFGPKVDDSDGLLNMWVTLFAAIDALGVPFDERVKAMGRDPQFLLDLADRSSRGRRDE